MEEISFLLKKYQKIGQKEQKIKKIVIEYFKEKYSKEIEPKNISLNTKNNTLKIKTNNILKTEIFLSNKKIEKEINNKLSIYDTNVKILFV